MTRAAGFAAALAGCAMLASAPAWPVTLSLACRADKAVIANNAPAPDWGPAFTLSVPFGEGVGLALIDAQTQKIEGMLFASDVIVGSFSASSETGSVAWTRASSIRAPLIGTIIRSDGHLIAVSVDRASGVDVARSARLFDSASGSLISAMCLPGQ